MSNWTWKHVWTSVIWAVVALSIVGAFIAWGFVYSRDSGDRDERITTEWVKTCRVLPDARDVQICLDRAP